MDPSQRGVAMDQRDRVGSIQRPGPSVLTHRRVCIQPCIHIVPVSEYRDPRSV